MAKSKKLLIDLCGVIVFFATAFFIMYAVTGKIPFFSEPRRNRRVSYRREKMDESEVRSNPAQVPEVIRLRPMEEPQVLSRGITRASQDVPNAFGGIRTMEEPQVLSRGIMQAPQRDREFDPAEIETLYNNAMETGGVAARQLKLGCSKCFRTILAFSQGANREWSGY